MKYTDANRPQNQKTVRGVIVNPVLRDGFDDTHNDLREDLETEDWFGLPYVVGADDTWHIRCLDGGAWDRSTLRGFADTMDGAIDKVLEMVSE